MNKIIKRFKFNWIWPVNENGAQQKQQQQQQQQKIYRNDNVINIVVGRDNDKNDENDNGASYY